MQPSWSTSTHHMQFTVKLGVPTQASLFLLDAIQTSVNMVIRQIHLQCTVNCEEMLNATVITFKEPYTFGHLADVCIQSHLHGRKEKHCR